MSNMTVHNLSMLFLVASLFSTSPVFAQQFSTSAQTNIVTSVAYPPAVCSNSVYKGKSFCQGNWTDDVQDSAAGEATAVTGYGTLRAYASSAVEAGEADEPNTTATGSVISNDSLSLVGLTVPAYLRLEGILSFTPVGDDNLGTAVYDIEVTPSGGDQYQCNMTNTTPPTCTLSVPVTPGEEAIFLQRVLVATASSIVPDPVAGTAVITGIAIGWEGGKGKNSIPGGGELRVSVRDADGHLIKGASVVGASGHKY